MKDIWKQPAKGFSEQTIGRTEEQIVQKEIEIGFKFPELYREHMKLQNGGHLWKSALNYNGEVNELLCNDATFDPIINHNGYKTLKDVLLEYMDKEKLESSTNTNFLYLDRLPILSNMGGHTILCFDYGYNVENEYEIPEIVYFELEYAEDGYEERIRLKSYDELISNLVYYGYESTSYYVGLKSNESIEKISELIEKSLDLQLEIKTDDGYGWYNFEKWYYGVFKLNASLSAYVKLTPNQFLSNTFLFQNNKEFNYVIDIHLRIGVDSFQDNSNFVKSIIQKKFQQFLSNVDWIFLEIPFNKENKIELEKVMQTYKD
ncbi:SMI1/KNR4 family protein [Flavobacterium reichenbachii]|uniref:Knr4/Smi1-like domain-containing protein n=1 Tax=Flavobacterium reichenbachii TaxID=362418 RepID=A0A085ZMF9_9FLAO|nr:SMI1/KNR4 family protein [Flavobacterium reichenbachii]KFF05623.1 hypothetical protein IW19_08880 [Flavobacterium reichenbachii]OXB17955.1 hypothetical protein B0A68_03190 [Flavobacterium reichenbachii]